MRILCIRHEADPTDDRITTWCADNGVTADIRRPFQGDNLGDITDDLAGVGVYGGVYNAYDAPLHPFLNEEYRMIDAAMTAGVPLLGLCQGAQMIAHHMGAFAGDPGHGQHEFGYYEVTPTDAGRAWLPAPMHFTQAHFHTFDTPAGATRLASSALFKNQAFAVGDRVMALQFHPEQTTAGFGRWMARGDDWGRYDAPGVQSKTEQARLMAEHDPAQHTWFMGFLDRFFGPRL
ncbi:glutamine amidotransferase [uncultured Tateyamaria sp.]|uniref:glutamine amidotransferase-related protein n=1 Tax=Tateyamaria sp. 1078 TaxID=3417464 RepID=UPI00261B9BC5|nr:glutamine amidotransferase [uncultured Tateyamaria sp.]